MAVRALATRKGEWWQVTVPSMPGLLVRTTVEAEVRPKTREAVARRRGVPVEEVADVEIEIWVQQVPLRKL